VTGETLQRFAQVLDSVAANNYPNKALDGTVTISDTTDSKGQNVLRVAQTGRSVGAQQLSADKNPTYDVS
jgi:hypothetical protein